MFPKCCSRLACALLCVLVAFARAAIDNPEVEPNDSKGDATLASSNGAGLDAGDTISGSTTGSAGSGAASADYFKITTKPRATGIYKYQLVLTSGTAGHTLSIRGLSQVLGTITPNSDVVMQTGMTSYPGMPLGSRTVQWYGFGASETVFVSVTGTGSTTLPYSAQLMVTSIAPIPVGAGFREGSISIDRAPANLTDVDFWVYSSSFGAISNYGNNNPNSLTRPYAPGTFYAACSNANTANNLASPPDDSSRSDNVLDYPGAVVNSSPTTGLNLGMRISDSLVAVSGASTKTNPFDVTWYCFTVVPNTIVTVPTGSASAAPAEVSTCERALVCFTVNVTRGTSPTSSGITVELNQAAINGPPIQLQDDGSGCDLVPGDLVYSGLVYFPPGLQPGSRTFSFVVRDDQGRSSQGEVVVDVVSCLGSPPPNDVCARAITIAPGQPVTGQTLTASIDSDAPSCRAGAPLGPGVWFRTTGNGARYTASLCGGPSDFDSVLTVYCGTSGCDNLVCIATDDNSCGTLSRTSWCTEAGGIYYIHVAGQPGRVGQFLLDVTQTTGCTQPVACAAVGACCLPDGCRMLTRAACTALRGEYLGDGEQCRGFQVQSTSVSPGPFPVAIPDNQDTGATATISFPPGPTTVSNLSVGVRLRHTYSSDLRVVLSHAARSAVLFYAQGGPRQLSGEYVFSDLGAARLGADGADPVPNRVYVPASPLAVFNGQLLAGTWTLRVIDSSATDVGSLDGFSFKRLTPFDRCPADSGCSPCAADYNADGGVDGADVFAFYLDWEAGLPCADVNLDGGVDGVDVQSFFQAWETGEC